MVLKLTNTEKQKGHNFTKLTVKKAAMTRFYRYIIMLLQHTMNKHITWSTKEEHMKYKKRKNKKRRHQVNNTLQQQIEL